MTAKQITLVKNSWRLLRDLDSDRFADLFYSKLFLDHPELRRLFPNDLSGQYQKLMSTLQAMIIRLDQMKEPDQELSELACRHVEYGVKPKHYRYVGSALLWTLQQVLDDDWSAEIAEAWTSYYQWLSATMLRSIQDDTTNKH